MGSDAGWRAELEEWLRPFLEALGHPARRAMCPLYVAGLIGPGERKGVQPMAERLGLPSHDALHHFIAAGVWDAAPLEAVLAREADRLVGGRDAFLVVDDTALPKKGTRSVGVAPQYASALGKNANCQVLVSLTLARREVPVPFALRLFLPEEWTADAARLERAGVPETWRLPRTKPETALAGIDRAITTGVRFGCALADAGYGISAAFRAGLSARGLRWAVGIPRILKVYPADVSLLAPPAGSRRKLSEPGQCSRSAEKVLAEAAWRRVAWRRGTKGRLCARFAAVRIRVADGPAQQIGGRPAQHLPGEEAWVVGERRASGETKYYLSNLPADAGLRTLAATIKARWACEQAHQQMKEELGLDYFEGRSWTGLQAAAAPRGWFCGPRPCASWKAQLDQRLAAKGGRQRPSDFGRKALIQRGFLAEPRRPPTRLPTGRRRHPLPLVRMRVHGDMSGQALYGEILAKLRGLPAALRHSGDHNPFAARAIADVEAVYSLIATAKLNGVDPRAWLADVLARIADHPASRLHELPPWHWRKPPAEAAAAS